MTTILLLGPTASGKSAAAMAIARQLPIEIVSVDSACVYRGMDIGTAKPSAGEQVQVRHHLIDLIDPWQPYSAARFVNDAHAAIADIRSRDAVPLLVGGTMLYARALIDGLDDLPQADAKLRERIDAQAVELGWPALHKQLLKLDPISAARLAPNDAQRIQRALEVIELTGMPMSQLLLKKRLARGAGTSDASARFCVIGLEPSDRSVLHQRIAKRFDAMLAAGLVDEVRRLRADARLTATMPSMRCVGYRQAWEMLDGAVALTTLPERAVIATRQLAKRQLTWLRSMPERLVVDCIATDASTRVLEHVNRALGNKP